MTHRIYALEGLSMAKVYQSEDAHRILHYFSTSMIRPAFPRVVGSRAGVRLHNKGAHGMNSHEMAVLVKGQERHVSRAQLYGRPDASKPLI